MAESAEKPVSFLVFGDHGYHLEWPSKNDRKNNYPSSEEWYEHHLDVMRREVGRQDPERLPAIEMSPVTGGYVLSTGLYRVSDAMHAACADQSCRFGLMLGDNIYPDGADGIDDVSRFEEILTKPLTRIAGGRDDFAIYSVLGNHDWKMSREGAEAQLEYLQSTPPFYMDGFSFRATPPGLEGEVEIFAIDTQIMLSGTAVNKLTNTDGLYEVDEDALVIPSENSVPRSEQERQLASWLDQALQESQARWKIVIGHHPLWSTAGGKLAQSSALRKLILPSLCRHADAYFSGHEHTLEVHSYDCSEIAPGSPQPPLTQVVSGAAGKQRMVNDPFRMKQDEADQALNTLFALGSTWGYAMATLAGDEMEIDFYSIGLDGVEQAVHSHTISNRKD